MLLARVQIIACFLITIVLVGHGSQQSPAHRPWPPGVQDVAPASPVLSPAEAMKTFYMPPGYRLELVASEPLIQDPVAIDWDLEGRLWAVEMPGYMKDIASTGEREPIGRIVVLEDEDGDGRMDRRTLFADGLVLARSLKVLDHGLLVGEPPNVWLMRDTNDDLRADTKELVTDRYGRLDANPEHNANGFYWALDNRMYTAASEVYFRLKGGAVEVHETLERGQWGVSQDDAGRLYRNTNESALHVDLVPTRYFARNPHLLRTRGSYERLANANEQLNTVWPVRPNPGTNRAYQTGIDRPDGSLARFTSVCAPLVYRGDRLPDDIYGNVFVAEPAANVVSRIVLDEDGATLGARKAYDRGEFLASTDERFRPVYLSNAPDGTLYIVDMYRGVIEHRMYITTYLRDEILTRKLERPTGLGRIYRVVHETTRRDRSKTLSTASERELVELLSHPNGWRRDTAQRLLVERLGDARSAKAARLRTSRYGEVVPRLVELVRSAEDPRTRLHALWTLDGIDAIEPEVVEAALEDDSRDVRASAVRVAERWLGEADHPIRAAVMRRLDDPEWAVRRQVAASLGAMAPDARVKAVVSLLARYGDDPITMDAALSGLEGSEAAVLEGLMRASAERTRQREAAITMLAATIVRGAEDAAVQALFASIAREGRDEWTRSALLRGAEVALLDAAMPGMPEKRGKRDARGTLPCPTCPGGRAGPGGAYAFRQPAPSAPASRERHGDELELRREPRALAALAAKGGELGTRAARVLSRVVWPGKPGAAAPVAPLTAEEQQRFDAGQHVFESLCAACHQSNGRGQEGLAPALVGSALALGPAEIPARILLQGKDGQVGLMPPLGSTLSDEQVADVLTYIRRAWGQDGTPVDAATVHAVRAATARRSRPWTENELKELAPHR